MALRAVGGSPAGHTRAARLLLPGAEACAAAASKNTLATGNMCVLNSAPAVTKSTITVGIWEFLGIPRTS
ncbi:MAG: hypothetical protein CBD47_01900 [Synechococcus sp. TMED187]|nr:MAG: hypothetical protein CBD47_01900 [Synechococcus sp. TMED187]